MHGVNQDGCLSPTLFSVYLKKLTENLRNSYIECTYRTHYMAVCYPDDLCLLSLTPSRAVRNDKKL